MTSSKITSPKITIVVDGPSASGKGTLSKLLASRLNFAYLDTGLLYRAVALFAINNNYINGQQQITNLNALLDYALNINFAKINLLQLSANNIAEGASIIAKNPTIRANLLAFHHNFAANPKIDDLPVGGSVLDGRDLGSVVFPNADIKFFVSADLQIRALRRYLDFYKIAPRSDDEKSNLANILKSLALRDENDTNRAIAPLKKMPDAIDIDNSVNTPQNSLDIMLKAIYAKYPYLIQ